jgi:hypothetical protein
MQDRMTVIVSVKINDGIVMASDSVGTFASGQTYLNADKIVNLIKGKPIGAMVTGDGGIGRESFATMFKDLRKRLERMVEGKFQTSYTVEQVTAEAATFFREKLSAEDCQVNFTLIRFCGYSTGRPLSEEWQLTLQGTTCSDPILVQDEAAFGIQFQGMQEAISRLWIGYSPRLQTIAEGLGVTAEQWPQVERTIMAETVELFVAAAMPIQDAIDLARFLVETTIGFTRFSMQQQPKTVGGPVEIAAITKHEGFQWVQRRHFYPAALNPS